MASSKRRRWIEMLRRGTAPAKSGRGHRLEDAELFEAHERGGQALGSIKESAEQLTAALARSRTQVDGLAERAQLLRARSESLAETTAKATEGIERVRVVGLNAGLEGARMPETQGAALTLLAEELRQHSQRTGELLEDAGATIAATNKVADALYQQADELREEIKTLGQQAGAVRAVAETGQKAWTEIGARLQSATGIEPGVAKLLTEAADHAKGLTQALSQLSGETSGLVRDALKPALVPLRRLLRDVLGGDEDESPAPPSVD